MTVVMMVSTALMIVCTWFLDGFLIPFFSYYLLVIIAVVHRDL